MDAALEINDSRRELPPGISPDVPLVAVAWRALRSLHRREMALLRESEDEAGKSQGVFVRVAEECFELRKSSAGQPIQEEVARRLEQALQTVGVSVLAPQGQSYTGELTELFENIALRTHPDLREPRIAEIVRPAILGGGGLIRMGKAIIAIPTPNE